MHSPGWKNENKNIFVAPVLARAGAMRAKQIAHVKGGGKTGGKKAVQSKSAKRKSASAMAAAAGNRAMQALAT